MHISFKELTMPISVGGGYAAGRYALQLAGNHVGGLESFEGGHATSLLVQEDVGGDVPSGETTGKRQYKPLKVIPVAEWDPFVVTCGTGMSRACYQWVADYFDERYSRKSGAVVLTDQSLRVVHELHFDNALITEVSLPACDASSKDPAKMTIKFTPTSLRHVPGDNSVYRWPMHPQKVWQPANFRLSISGLEQDCHWVSRVEPIVLDARVAINQVGQTRVYEKEPAGVTIPDLAITLPQAHADKFFKWHEDSVVRGNSGGPEKTGTLQYLSPDKGQAFFTLTFKNLGIFKVTYDKMEAASEHIRRVKVEMYCEAIHFDYSSAWN
jgi:hypothetical protein